MKNSMCYICGQVIDEFEDELVDVLVLSFSTREPVPYVPRRVFHRAYVLPQRKEMTETIKADLERLFPTGCGDHFLAPARQELLLSVLSLWADLNTETAYRQVTFCGKERLRACLLPFGAFDSFHHHVPPYQMAKLSQSLSTC